MVDADVCIIGAGPAGSALACQLAAEGLRVIIIERSRFDTPRAGESLSLNAKTQLKQLGLWDAVETIGPTPCFGVRSCWGGSIAIENSYLNHVDGNAWHVDRQRFDMALALEAVARGAVLKTGSSVTKFQPDVAHWNLIIDNGSRPSNNLKVRFLVDSSGRNARISQRLGAQRIVFDRLVGVVAANELKSCDEQYLLVESTPDGWWSSAPTDKGLLITTLMSDSDLIDGSGKLYSAYVTKRRNAILTSNRLANTQLNRGPTVFSAVSQRLQRIECHQPWLAVGDAALAVDPLTGQGVARALENSEKATQVIYDFFDGNGKTAIFEYEKALDQKCTEYLLERPFYYGNERRWPDATFWQRRLSVCDRIKSYSSHSEFLSSIPTSHINDRHSPKEVNAN